MTSTLRPGHFLAVSVDPGSSPLPRPVVRALAGAGLDAADVVDRELLLRAQAGGPASAVADADATLGALVDPTAVPSSSGDELERWVSTVLPPAGRAILESSASGPRVRVATDGRAIGEVYESRGAGWAMASTSPSFLAAACEASLDEPAVVLYSQLGHFLGDDTPWIGVRRLGPGEIVTLQRGVVVSAVVPAPVGESMSLAAATRAVVGAAGARPVELELSGGLDSRLILAAMVRADIDVSQCFTIGSPGEADRELAVSLAEITGLRHEIVDTASIADDSPASLALLAIDAGADRGWVANPIDAAPLHWVENGRSPAAGLSGQNGEIARGFYYRGPHRGAPAGRRIELLTRWRMTANAALGLDLLRPELGHTLTSAVVDSLGEWLDNSSLRRFLESTDDFYLRHRMTRWVGPAYGAAARRHPVVAPFFSAGFIDAAGRLSVSERRHSTAVARAVVELDAGLADHPLAGGPSPSRLAAGSRAAALAGVTAQARKGVRKVSQRFGRAPARPSGTGAVAAALASRVDRLIDTVNGDPLLSSEGLLAIRTNPDPRDLSFLLSLAAWRSPGEHEALQSLASPLD